MKEIDVIFRRHERLPIINELLYKHKVAFLFYDINGRAREKLEAIPEVISHEAPYTTGRKRTPLFVSGVKLEMIVPDHVTKPIVADLMAILSTGSDTDGRIFIKDISNGYDIGSKKNWDATQLIEAE